jgi:hypothetical protein
MRSIRTFGIALAILLCAGAARAETSVSLGGGFAYELAGLNFGFRSGNYEGYFGVGLLSFLPGVAGGARYFFNPDGSGFFIGVNAAFHTDDLRIDEPDAIGGRFFTATLTPGYRLAFSHFFLQAALGGGAAYQTTYWSDTAPTRSWFVIPDAMLGLGFRI